MRAWKYCDTAAHIEGQTESVSILTSLYPSSLLSFLLSLLRSIMINDARRSLANHQRHVPCRRHRTAEQKWNDWF